MKRAAFVLGCIIVAVWLAAFILDAVVSDYEIPTGIQPLMMLVSGALFGYYTAQRNKD